MCVHIDRESKVGRQIAADLMPGFAGVIAPHDVPMQLHVETIRTRPVQCQPVDTETNFHVWIRDVLGFQSPVDWLPRFATIVGPESTRSRDGNKDPLRITRIQQNRMQTHSSRTRLPFRTSAMATKSG